MVPSAPDGERVSHGCRLRSGNRVLETVHARKHPQAPGSIVDFNAKTTANKFRIKMLHRFANVASLNQGVDFEPPLYPLVRNPRWLKVALQYVPVEWI